MTAGMAEPELEVSHHDDIYDRAPRMQFVATPHGLRGAGRARPVARRQTSASDTRPTTDDAPRPLDGWSSSIPISAVS